MAELTRAATVYAAGRNRAAELAKAVLSGAGVAAWLVLTYAYILFAAVFVILLSLQSDMLAIPSPLTLRWFGEALNWPAFRTALTTSIVVALVVTALACVIGTMAAVAIARYRFPGSRALQSIFMAPLALPQLILAIGLVILFSRLVGIIGIRLTATLPGLIISHLVVAVPWMIRTVGAVLATLDPHLEEMAQSLGASPARAFFLVTLPSLYRGMVAGAIFAFIISFGNLELSLMVYPPSLQPLPILLYDQVRATPDLRIPAVSVLTMLIIGVGIALADRIAGLDKAL
jgi:putative spermidine/putrescine transport system permease protein